MIRRPNRRRWIRQSAALVGSAALTAVVRGAASQEPKDPGWIDAHSHIWTRDVEKFPLANGQTLDDLSPASFTDAELLKVCEPFGVRRAVLIQHHIYHGWDNTYLIDAAKRHPDRFRVVGMVDDLSPKPGEQMTQLLSKHVTGFRITPWIRGAEEWLDGSGMAEMWKTAAETGQAICCLIDPSDLEAVGKMCQRYPDTPVVIDHFARIGVDGMIRKSDVKALCEFQKIKSVKVKISAYYALGKKKPPYNDLVPMIRQLLDAFGPERLMWASDSPYQLGEGNSYQASLDLVQKRIDFLSQGDREWLLRKTAAETYHF